MSFARRIGIGFYWIGWAATMACLAIILTGNMELVWRFEHRGFPLSWVFAGIAVLAFLVAEFSDSVPALRDEAKVPVLQPAPEWDTAGSEG
jgi:hypothetical protein